VFESLGVLFQVGVTLIVNAALEFWSLN
jgi:hypothetical protein